MRLTILAAVGLLTATVLSAPALALSITLTASSDHPSAKVGVSGSGFGANEAIDVYFDTTDELLVLTNGTGGFAKHTLSVPADALPGEHWISAIERDNGKGVQKTFTVSTSWAEEGFTQKGKRENPFENVISTANVSQLESAWTVPSNPTGTVIGNGIVYSASQSDGTLYALDPSSGAVLWSVAPGGQLVGGPAVANGIVYLGSMNNNLYAYDAVTGALKWTGLTAAGIEASPTVANGIVYIGSDDQQLWAFDAISGQKLWWKGTNGRVTNSGAVANGKLFFGSTDGTLYAIDAGTGANLWSTDTGGTIYFTPATSGGILYLASADNLKAFAAGTGAQLWTQSTGGLVTAPALANGVVYAGSQDKTLYAFDANTGAQKWSLATNSSFGAPIVANGIVYAPTDLGDQKFYALNAKTGARLWAFQAPPAIVSSAAIADGMLYFGDTGADVLYAFALDGGNNAAYKPRPRPSYALLHPDHRLIPLK